MCKIIIIKKGDNTRVLWDQPLMNLVLSAKNIHYTSKSKYLYIFLTQRDVLSHLHFHTACTYTKRREGDKR